MRGILASVIVAVAVCARPGGATATPTLLSARGGPIPVPYQPYDYRLFPSTDLNVPILTDGNTGTGITLEGLDAVMQSNGAVVDTGTFALFTYQLDPGMPRVELWAHAQVEYHSPADVVFISVLDLRDNLFKEPLAFAPAATPDFFHIAFDATGNTGNWPPFTDITIDDVVSPTGVITFAVQMGYGAQFDMPGRVIGHLNEVFVGVPEPATALALGPLGLTMLGRGAARRRGCG